MEARLQSEWVWVRRLATRSWRYGEERLSLCPITLGIPIPKRQRSQLGQPQRRPHLGRVPEDIGVGGADVLDPEGVVVQPDRVAADQVEGSDSASTWRRRSDARHRRPSPPSAAVRRGCATVGSEDAWLTREGSASEACPWFGWSPSCRSRAGRAAARSPWRGSLHWRASLHSRPRRQARGPRRG
jgi:hypothetical protein